MQIHTTVSSFIHKHAFTIGVSAVFVLFAFTASSFVVANGESIGPEDSHLVSLYVDDQESVVPTRAKTVGEFLSNTDVKLSQYDLVEPAKETPIDADNFRITIYEARPVTIYDGSKVIRTFTPHQGPRLIVEKAGITTYPEDTYIQESGNNFVEEQILGEKITIQRATPVTFSLYGSDAAVYRTHANTVAEFLTERGITVEDGATLTPAADTPISPNLVIYISKFGKQVTTVVEDVAFDIESVPDPTQRNGAISIVTPGVLGKKQVIYELVLRDGKEVSRVKVQEVVTEYPQKQVQTIGTKPGSGISRSKGVFMFTDSKGIVHRETFYDLSMSRVMQNCGAGGQYSVRSDGVKVDPEGYVIIAANLNIYPRCSIVETSVGPAKVYDTGGFALVHPYGFDIATDWSNNDGR